MLNRDLLAEACDEIITDALRVHDVDFFRSDRAELLTLIKAARVVRDLIRKPVTITVLHLAPEMAEASR